MKKNVFNFLAIIFICTLALSCGLSAENKASMAFSVANPVLVQFYIKGDIEGAFKNLDPKVQKDFKLDEFKTLYNKIITDYGHVQSLETDSYIIIPNKNAAMLFYQANHATGKAYHRIVMLGNDKKGYKVGGLYSQKQPYGEKYKIRKKVKTPTVIK